MEGEGFGRITLNCSTRATVRRTGEYLGYGRRPYISNYPIGVSVPRFVSLITRNGFRRTCGIVTGASTLPTIYNEIYPRRERYRSGYIHNVGNRPITVNELREFITSCRGRRSRVGPTSVRGGNGGITMVNSNPDSLAYTNSLTRLNCSIAVFRTLRITNNILICNVPRFELPGTVMTGRIRKLGTLNISVRAGIIVNHDVSISSVLAGCSTMFVNSNTNLPEFVNVRNRGLGNICSTGRFLAHVGLVGTCGSSDHAPIRRKGRITIINNKGITVSTTEYTVELNTRGICIVCHHSVSRLPTETRRIRGTRRRLVRFGALAGPIHVLNSRSRGIYNVRYISVRLNRPSRSNEEDPGTIRNDGRIISISDIVVTVNASPGPLVGAAAVKLRISGHNYVITSRSNGASETNIFTNNSAMANTTAIVGTVNTNGGSTTTVSGCLSNTSGTR